MRTAVKLLLVGLSLIVAAPAWSAAPQYLPLQGVLTDRDGVPIDNVAVSLRFSLHTAETGGTEAWSETQSVTPMDGLFVAYLGQVTTLSLSTFRDNGALWLEVKVDTDGPMPRVRLGTNPFSGYAEYCGNVPAHQHPGSEITGTVPAGVLPASVVVGPQATCTGTQKVTGADASGQLTCGPDLDTLANLSCATGQVATREGTSWICGPSGFTTEGQLTTLLDDNYRAATWVPAWTDVTDKPAGLVVGAQACGGRTKVSGITAGGALVCSDVSPLGILSVTGTITAGSLEYSPAKTRTYSVPAIEFTYLGGGSVGGSLTYRYVTSGSMFAAVHLPDGATVTELRCLLSDTSAAHGMNVYLARNSGFTGQATYNGVGTTVAEAPGQVTRSTTYVGIPIDNSTNTYFLSFYPDAGCSSNCLIYSCYLDYTVTTP